MRIQVNPDFTKCDTCEYSDRRHSLFNCLKCTHFYLNGTECSDLHDNYKKAETRPCPYPLLQDDGTAKDCINKDHCGCDEQDDDDQETDCPIHGKCEGGECPRC
jgi:hypothetical protein